MRSTSSCWFSSRAPPKSSMPRSAWMSRGRESVTAFVNQTPPEHGKNPRPTIKAKEGEAVKIGTC